MTLVDWAHDSAWRFMPLARDPLGGLPLHSADLAVNKALALPALCWAAVGKDPGLTPLSLLELLKRRGRYRPEDFTRLHLAEPFDLIGSKQVWLTALADAEAFARSRDPDEVGCLYHAAARGSFVVPSADRSLEAQGIVAHFGAPGGVIPRVASAEDARSEV